MTQNVNVPNVKVYTLEKCTHCPVLKQMLKDKNIEYEEIDIANPKTMAYLFSKDPSIVSAPILEIEEKLYTNIYTIEKLEDILKSHDIIS
jgi:glutaredoxin